MRWIREHKLPFAFILLTVLVALTFGVWQGATYLQEEMRYFDLEPREGLIERQETEGVVYHHTAVSDRPITRHHEFHLTRGWQMVGYHFHIREDGTIEQGRPHNVMGVHAREPANSTTLSVAFSGNMNERPPTEAQYESAIELQYWLEEYQDYGELPVSGHKDWMDTSCPGRYTDLDVIREGMEKEREDTNEVAETGIIINSFADFPAVEPLANELDAPIYLRGIDVELDKAVVAGGSAGGVDAENIVILSGECRYETAEKIKDYLDERRD